MAEPILNTFHTGCSGSKHVSNRNKVFMIFLDTFKGRFFTCANLT